MNWQSIRSVTPPCPGMIESKSLIPYARFIAEAQKPPKGAMTDVKPAMSSAWSWMGAMVTLRKAGGRLKKRNASMNDRMLSGCVCSKFGVRGREYQGGGDGEYAFVAAIWMSGY